MQINVSSGRALKSSLCARRSTVLARTRASMQSMVWRSLSARRRFRPGGTGVAISLRERTSAPAEHVPLRDHQPQLDELLNATAESLRNPRDERGIPVVFFPRNLAPMLLLPGAAIIFQKDDFSE